MKILKSILAFTLLISFRSCGSNKLTDEKVKDIICKHFGLPKPAIYRGTYKYEQIATYEFDTINQVLIKDEYSATVRCRVKMINPTSEDFAWKDRIRAFNDKTNSDYDLEIKLNKTNNGDWDFEGCYHGPVRINCSRLFKVPTGD